MKYVVERMWMVIGNTTVDAANPKEAVVIAEDMPLPTVVENVEDTARVVDVYQVN